MVFLDYDGVLTPIVNRPKDGVICDSMRDTVQALAQRCTVCVVSGRDRAVGEELMGVNDLVVAGGHGFDIWSPNEGEIQHDAASGFSDVVEAMYRLRAGVGWIPGVVVEPKRASVAMHYQLVDQDQRDRLATTAGAVFAEPDRRKVMPGKMVHKLHPKIDWGNADDLEIADRAPAPTSSSSPPGRWNSCCRLRPADQGRSPSEREPCPTSHSPMTTSTPAPRACGSR